MSNCHEIHTKFSRYQKSIPPNRIEFTRVIRKKHTLREICVVFSSWNILNKNAFCARIQNHNRCLTDCIVNVCMPFFYFFLFLLAEYLLRRP